MMTSEVPEISSLPSNVRQSKPDIAGREVTSGDFAPAETKVITNQAKKKKKKKKNKTREQVDENANADQRNPLLGAPSDMTENGGRKSKGPFIINSVATGPSRRQSVSKQRQGANGVGGAMEEERDGTVTEPASTS
jgi:hypothetical protein